LGLRCFVSTTATDEFLCSVLSGRFSVGDSVRRAC
jgi:hypothetical protein